MDFFGIGAALRGAAACYFLAARDSGRTQSLIDNLHDGDLVVFADSASMRQFNQRCRDADKRIDSCVMAPHQLHDLSRLKVRGRVVFDHGWVERAYRDTLESTAKMIDRAQSELSNSAAPPAELASQVEYARRWADLP